MQKIGDTKLDQAQETIALLGIDYVNRSADDHCVTFDQCKLMTLITVSLSCFLCAGMSVLY